jgi:hypothetical protein
MMRERCQNGVSERCQNAVVIDQSLSWSGQQDLNLRPGVPKTPALPGCAMPRSYRVAASIHASPCASKPRRIRAKPTPHPHHRTKLSGM